MADILKREPELVVEYTDPVEGFKGWLAIDALLHRLCAGGLRVQFDNEQAASKVH